jgi:hypothetical protein
MTKVQPAVRTSSNHSAGTTIRLPPKFLTMMSLVTSPKASPAQAFRTLRELNLHAPIRRFAFCLQQHYDRIADSTIYMA